jgi:hypothetical protein
VAQPFDPDHLTLSGNPVPVAPKVEYWDGKSLGNFSVSENGVLIYRSAFSSPSRLVWLDRTGKQLATLGDPGNYAAGRLSPDGRTAVIPRDDPADASKSDLWLLDVQRGIFSRLTLHPALLYSARPGRPTAAVWPLRRLRRRARLCRPRGAVHPSLSRKNRWPPSAIGPRMGAQSSYSSRIRARAWMCCRCRSRISRSR